MSTEPKLRPMGEILANIDTLPLSRDPFRQMTEIESLNRLLIEAEMDHGADSRDGELRRHPEAARVLLGVIDRMLPVFDDPEAAWAKQPHTRHLFPKDYYQVDDLLCFWLGEYLPGLPGYAEALVEVVRRNPQAWSVEALGEWARQHPGSLVGGVDIDALLGRLAQVERPASTQDREETKGSGSIFD